MSKKGIIYETLNEVRSLNIQKQEDGLLHLSGCFGVCGVRNNNQRVYETKNYAKMVESMQQRIKKAPIPGELEHPQTMNITLENVSHRIDSISIDENGVVSGEITLLDTPKGRIARAIVEGGLPLFISSRASGNVDRNGNVTLENIQTYDLVGSPGFSEAELHLNENQCYESINESMCFIGDKDEEKEEKIEENIDMTNEELVKIQETLAELESKVEYLTEQNNLLQEQIDDKEDIDIKQIAEGIQDWILNEYSPELQKWIVEEYSEKLQNWIVENYSKEIQNWITEEYSNKVQEWVIEHYSPEVQKWVTEEFSPEIQNWIVNEYSQGIQDWVTEHLVPELKKDINESKVKVANLDMIDNILEALDNKKVEKPVYGRKAMITEGATPKYIAEMPDVLRVKYDMASQDVKESVQRKARIYDWSKPNAVQRFWESVDLDNAPEVHTITEGLNEVTDLRERTIRESIRNWRRR